jgi:predicted kinase
VIRRYRALVLLVISGLPGTGKSAAGAALAREMDAVHLSVDEVEDAILGAGFQRDWTTGVAAYEAVRAAAEQNLGLGRFVIVDAVNDSAAARLTWSNAATATRTPLLFIVLKPPPDQEHQRRLANRIRHHAHVPEPSWVEVRARAASYEPWDGEYVVIDSAQPIEAVVRDMRSAIRDAR